MAVKKTNIKEEVKVEVNTKNVVAEKEEKTIEETPIVEVEVEDKNKVDVLKEDIKLNNDNQPEQMVRIKLREDHKFNVGSEMYDLKKGESYMVPISVKRRLNGAGVLAPL